MLVVADFPTVFDERSAARLVGITAGGIPCGVITLVARDLDRPLPPGVTAEDLEAMGLPPPKPAAAGSGQAPARAPAPAANAFVCDSPDE